MSLHAVGRTGHGHYRLQAASRPPPGRLQAASRTQPGLFHDVLVSKDGARVSCDCQASDFHPDARNGRLTVSRADVLAGNVQRCCWHLRHGARVAPLITRGYVLRSEIRA